LAVIMHAMLKSDDNYRLIQSAESVCPASAQDVPARTWSEPFRRGCCTVILSAACVSYIGRLVVSHGVV